MNWCCCPELLSPRAPSTILEVMVPEDRQSQEGPKTIVFSLPSTGTLNRTRPALGLSGLESTGARSKLKSVAAKTLELSV